MRILAIDVGTGTQDILLLDTEKPAENAVKLVLPSPTEIAARRIRRATEAGSAIALTGTIQGGGPCHWAVNDHIERGLPVYATLLAAQTFDDDPEMIGRMGVTLVSEDELPAVRGEQIVLRDLDLPALRETFARYAVSPEVDGIALGCLDHGASPPGYSDRLFRFEHLRRVVERRNSLLEFASRPEDLPDYLTRARALVHSVDVDAPVVFMDTGPSAAVGALLDEHKPHSEEHLLLNVGNMHLLAFDVVGTRIHSLYEHHTGEVTADQVAALSRDLLEGTLTHEAVFETKGHGAAYIDSPFAHDAPAVVTGPQRRKLKGTSFERYEAAPWGDMMIAGCFGLVAAFGEAYPSSRDAIAAALEVPWWDHE
jgi:uncharacterized protein (DUF1786 family)